MAGIHLNRGPKWPAIRPYIWKPLRGADHFVEQVHCEPLKINARALVEGQPLPWKIRNPIAEYLHHKEKRKLSEFVGGALSFIATKCTEIECQMSRDFASDSQRLFKMSEKLSRGQSMKM
jgi:hypothetical protein